MIETYPDSLVQVIGINSKDKDDVVKKDVEKHKLPYPNGVGRGTPVLKDYKVVFLPFLYILDRDGKVVRSEMFLKFDDLKKEVDGLLNEKAPRVPEAY